MVTLFAIILSLISVFLILLVLVQRGRGGGLTGALGGMGGQSAFGTKAGDTFTRITIVAATVWILVAILALKVLTGSGGKLGDARAAQGTSLPDATAPETAAGGTLTSPPATGDDATAEVFSPAGTVESPTSEPSSPPVENSTPANSNPSAE